MASPIKERLTGALILVAAIVIVVPEMFSGARPDAGQETGMDADIGVAAPVRSYEMAVDPAGSSEVAQETLAPRSTGVAADDGPVDPVAVPPPVVESAPLPVAPEVEEPPGTVASASPPPASPAPASDPSAKAWWVQLGRFSAKDNAEQLARRLRDRGFKVAVSQVRADGKDWHLVRAGPAGDRSAAEALQKRLSAAGQRDSFVVAP